MDDAQAEALNGAIRTICIRHRARAAARFAEFGLHPGQEAVLFLLADHGPQNQRQLADGAGCEPPTITLMVRKLAAAGVLSRRVAAHDARAVTVELTDAGRELIRRLREAWRELAEETVAGLRDTSPEQLVAALTDLARGLRQARDAEPR
jgi:DNA-binding MarR family transcriptional regulator